MKAIEIYNDKSLKTTSKEVQNAIIELVFNHTGLNPYKEQIKAAKEIFKGNICDMKTGEGKTLVVLLSLLMVAREGRKVYVVTSNDYLSERDFDYSRELLLKVGLKSIFLKSAVGGTNKEYEDNDVIYATGSTLIFDYLRGIKADYDFAIIDEIDYVLVECANHDFSVSNGESLVTMPVEVFKICKSISDIFTYAVKNSSVKKADRLFDLEYGYDYIVDYTHKSCEVTTRGYEKVQDMFKDSQKSLMFLESLQATLIAKHFFIKGEHYFIEDGKIVVIDNANGRKSVNGSNDISIQTAIEIKEGLEVTPKPLLTNTCSFPVFFSIFKTLTGISGTASYVPYDFDIIFNKHVVKIKEHKKNRRKEIYKYFDGDEERLNYLCEISFGEKNPILIVTESDKRSNEIAEKFRHMEHTKKINVLDNYNLEKEKQLLQEIKGEDQVLISSKIVGRGTDIELAEKFEDGLTVILANRFFSERTERQIIGRTGRNGAKGKCYILTSKTDKIYEFQHKKKFKKSERYIRKLQCVAESKEFTARKHIYIRSKLFFDQDKAIKERLSSFNSLEEVKNFLDKEENPLCQMALVLVEKTMKQGFNFLPMHNTIFISNYEKIRPYYQQQFLRYNDIMADTLYNTDGFNRRGREYVNTGKEIIAEVLIRFLYPLVVKNEKGSKERKTEISD